MDLGGSFLRLHSQGGLLLLGDGNLQIFSSDRTVVHPASSLDFIGVADKPEPANRDPIYIALWLEQVIKYMLTNTLDPDHAGGGFLDTLVTSEPALEYFGGRANYSPIRPEGENSGSPSRIAQELSALTERNMLVCVGFYFIFICLSISLSTSSLSVFSSVSLESFIANTLNFFFWIFCRNFRTSWPLVGRFYYLEVYRTRRWMSGKQEHVKIF